MEPKLTEFTCFGGFGARFSSLLGPNGVDSIFPWLVSRSGGREAVGGLVSSLLLLFLLLLLVVVLLVLVLVLRCCRRCCLTAKLKDVQDMTPRSSIVPVSCREDLASMLATDKDRGSSIHVPADIACDIIVTSHMVFAVHYVLFNRVFCISVRGERCSSPVSAY